MMMSAQEQRVIDRSSNVFLARSRTHLNRIESSVDTRTLLGLHQSRASTFYNPYPYDQHHRPIQSNPDGS